jgi:adenine-specific DNA-methyltransferase
MQNENLIDLLKAKLPHIFENEELNLDLFSAFIDTQYIASDFGLVWPGKKEAFEAAQDNKSVALKFDALLGHEDTKNMFIAGDNELALRAMQAEFSEAVKMIYIDPPYNTGNDHFLYPDNYKEDKKAYSKRTNQAELVANDTGHQHAAWLSMMATRLLLAKNLLKKDGVIFLSIDDAELYNLKLLCDEVFGADNFVANMVRHCKVGSGHDSSQLAIEYDYVLVYAKQKSELKFNKEKLDTEKTGQYKLSDAHVETRGKYYLRDLDYKGTYSESMDYAIAMPDETELFSGGRFGEPNTWRWSEKKFHWGVENDYIVIKKGKNGWKVYLKQYQYANNLGLPMERNLPYRASVQFLNSKGSQEIKELFGEAVFSFPKSTELLKYLIQSCCGESDLILDFFAGSSSTAQAVMALNMAENLNHNFICVQLPEPCPEGKAAYTQGYKTIAELSKARIEKAIEKLKSEFGDDVRLSFKSYEV